MKPYWLPVFVSLLFFAGAAKPQEVVDNQFTRAGLMRAIFRDFEETLNPKTARKEYVFNMVFLDLAPKGELKRLRRGDQFAGYTVGEFIKREPVWLPNDGYAAGTLPTLELIHTKSGKKHVLEPEKAYALPRAR